MAGEVLGFRVGPREILIVGAAAALATFAAIMMSAGVEHGPSTVYSDANDGEGAANDNTPEDAENPKAMSCTGLHKAIAATEKMLEEAWQDPPSDARARTIRRLSELLDEYKRELASRPDC